MTTILGHHTILMYPWAGIPSRFHIHPLALLTALGDLLAHLLLRELLVLLKELSCAACIVLLLDEAQRSEVVSDRLLLPAQTLPQVATERDERGAHDPVGNDLVVVRLEQEEDDARRENDVPLLYHTF